MAVPGTPTRSIARSALSTPSTPSHYGSPPELTPRSKVKAMLAALDDDSDESLPVKPAKSPRNPLYTVSEKIRNPSGSKLPEHEHVKETNNIEGVENEDEDEDPQFLPRGRLAARMSAEGAGLSSPNQDIRETAMDVHSDELENAYTRIRKRLVSGRQEPTNQNSLASENATTIQDAEDSIGGASGRESTPGHDIPDDRRSTSPGLFLTPEKPDQVQKPSENLAIESGTESDEPANLQTNARFLELVARKRAERESKQAAEDEKKKARRTQQLSFEQQLSRDASSDSDLGDSSLTEKRLTQQSRPTRKASKKALEEMSRETQRMSRNMQLAHQAKTKKKITKDSLLARFNFRSTANPHVEVPQPISSSTAASSAPASDMDEKKDQYSPPTSPAEPDEPSLPPIIKPTVDTSSTPFLAQAFCNDDDLPTMLDVLSQSAPKLDKGKGKAIDVDDRPLVKEHLKNQNPAFIQRQIKVRLPEHLDRSEKIDLDSGSDLEVVPSKRSRKVKSDVFENLPAAKEQEKRSLQSLRALAHLNSPGKLKRGKKTALSLSEMQSSLQKRARQQAVEERNARIEDLKSRGIIVQTAEERQQDQAEVEDMLGKARQQGEEIMQKEKRAAKKQKIANGEVDDLPDTSDEDEDYLGDEESDVELSGSEEGDDGQGDDANEEEDPVSDGEASANESEITKKAALGKDDPATSAFLDDEASEDGDDEEAEDLGDESTAGPEEIPGGNNRRPRKSNVVIDDDDDDNMKTTPKTVPDLPGPRPDIPLFPLGAPHFGATPMGMTQAFAATMAETQDENGEEQDSLALLDKMPEPDFPHYDSYDSCQMIEDSQNTMQQQNTNGSSKDIDLQFSQSQIRFDVLGDSQGHGAATQMSEMPDPTQDVGFVLSSPPPERSGSVPPSTVDTVLLPNSLGNGSPVKKRGRLQRRQVVEDASSDTDKLTTPRRPDDSRAETSDNAFDAMRKARKAAKAAADKEAFDKKKSEAKGMVEEQAQESEDEYAGLGGVSDEDSNEEDVDVDKMMDHGEVDIDERKLAQLFANKERASDERAIEKLYKDINSGMLRRKRGAEFDLSDSDDDAEARRKRKQREFAKMRKALLADENVGKIAADPKKIAFLQSIEDRENDDDMDFLDRPAEESFRMETSTQDESASQSQSQPQQPNLPASVPNKRKRPLEEAGPGAGNMRPPAVARRTAAPRKPGSLAEIRDSVSFLIEDPGAMNIALDPSSSASEDEASRQEGNHHRNPRRTPANPIIDRLSLRRAESTSTSTTSRLAFHDPATNPAIGGFKVPSLLRRATTSQLGANGADANGISTAAVTERAAGGGEKGDFVRKGGTKRSSVNFASREKERKAAVEEVERRRAEERERVGRLRRNGLGSLRGGSFE